MSAYLSDNQFEELAKLAHQLAGAGGSYGFPTISDAARRVEYSANEDKALDEIRTAVADLSKLCRQAAAVGKTVDGKSASTAPIKIGLKS
jgi:HPt (histidine-containing phosphotransfer) domain-containing protein